MTANLFVQVGVFGLVLALCVRPLGRYMALVYEGRIPSPLGFLRPIERLCYRLAGIDA